jgi:membrane fusion protein (multidrug efflux system)
MNKPRRYMLTGLAIVFGGLLAFNLIKSFLIKRFFSHYEPPAVSVSSAVARARNWYPVIQSVGDFRAINGVEINSEVSGKIVNLNFISGQFIEKDAPLVDLDDSVEQATLQFNQADLVLQGINYKRQTELLKKGATPSSSVDQAHATLMQAQANVERTQAQINLKHIKAPFSGRLGIRQVNLGQYVIPGQTDIVTLQSVDPLHLRFHVPEQLLNRLYVHQPITFTVEQSPHLQFVGEISAISSKVDNKTHNIELQAILANCPEEAMGAPEKSSLVSARSSAYDTKLTVVCNSKANTQNKITAFNFVPGMFASIQIIESPIPNVVVVPTTAISYGLYGNSVFMIEKDKKDPKILYVRRQFVKTGEQKGNSTIIISGIKPGQEIVSSGELKLENGTRVVINNSIQLDETPDLEKIGQ